MKDIESLARMLDKTGIDCQERDNCIDFIVKDAPWGYYDSEGYPVEFACTFHFTPSGELNHVSIWMVD